MADVPFPNDLPGFAAATMATSPPKKGERYRCSQCGMEIQVTADCHCQHPEHVHFECCGRALVKA